MSIPLVERARAHAQRTALVAPGGTLSYMALLERSAAAAARLLDGSGDLDGLPVAYLVPPGWEYVSVQWGIWRAGGLAVPLSPASPPAELAHVLDDAAPEVVITHPDFVSKVQDVAHLRRARVVQTTGLLRTGITGVFPDLEPDRAALMMYTSGTTGRPKGVVITHGNIEAQVTSMVEAWGWSASDRVLSHLPLHHVHGIVNVITTALWAGACCDILQKFDAWEVWEHLAEGRTTVYMAVPTVYRRLIEAWEKADPARQQRWAAGARRCRLMVSGSAALPIPLLERWEAITGHRLLERYGMTEIGMALSNPLNGSRRPGFVGTPMPGVEVRLVDETDTPVPPGRPGEIQVRGPGVFLEYWGRPQDTEAAFAEGRWFRTGDEAVVEGGAYRILGRMDVDILKTGGEKVSALEVEDVLRHHPGVADVAVVGVDDPEWGQRVCAAVVPRRRNDPVPAESLRAYAKERLATFKVPKEIKVVEELPTNEMGKVTKGAVRGLFGG